MQMLDKIVENARLSQRHIVLAEGEDSRIIEAALRANREGLARITLLGNKATIGDQVRGSDINIIDPTLSLKRDEYGEKLYELRRAKGMSREKTHEIAGSALGFAAMMVREGDADGTVAGAIATTADVIRHALQIIGKAEGVSLVSSFFLILLCEPHHPKKGTFVFADCGIVVDPDYKELADIAIQSAGSFRQITSLEPAVAMLSFSTGGSAAHERVTKVVQATNLVKERRPDLCIDGELQFDTAFVEAVSDKKLPGSPLKGDANVFVFPNLEAANIGYKIAQRIGGAMAIGPILQGLAKPANDLSRGCNANDVFHMIAVTANQVRKDKQDQGSVTLT